MGNLKYESVYLALQIPVDINDKILLQLQPSPLFINCFLSPATLQPSPLDHYLCGLNGYAKIHIHIHVYVSHSAVRYAASRGITNALRILKGKNAAGVQTRRKDSNSIRV